MLGFFSLYSASRDGKKKKTPDDAAPVIWSRTELQPSSVHIGSYFIHILYTHVDMHLLLFSFYLEERGVRRWGRFECFSKMLSSSICSSKSIVSFLLKKTAAAPPPLLSPFILAGHLFLEGEKEGRLRVWSMHILSSGWSHICRWITLSNVKKHLLLLRISNKNVFITLLG